MPARLLPLLLLALLLPLRPRPAAAQRLQADTYTSVSSRTSVSDLPLGPRFYLRDTQCLGYIPRNYLCGERAPLGVSVRVSDRVAFPLIHVDASLRNVSIGRRPDAYGTCRNVATVETRVSCEGWTFKKSIGPLPLPRTPTE